MIPSIDDFSPPLIPRYPLPDAAGLAKTKDFYLNRFGRKLTDAEAGEVLGSVMHLLYLQSLPPGAPLEEPKPTASESPTLS